MIALYLIIGYYFFLALVFDTKKQCLGPYLGPRDKRGKAIYAFLFFFVPVFLWPVALVMAAWEEYQYYKRWKAA